MSLIFTKHNFFHRFELPQNSWSSESRRRQTGRKKLIYLKETDLRLIDFKFLSKTYGKLINLGRNFRQWRSLWMLVPGVKKKKTPATPLVLLSFHFFYSQTFHLQFSLTSQLFLRFQTVYCNPVLISSLIHSFHGPNRTSCDLLHETQTRSYNAFLITYC